MRLSCGFDLQSRRKSTWTSIFRIRWPTNAGMSYLDSTVTTATVSIKVIAIVAFNSISPTISTGLNTEWAGEVEIESRLTRRAFIAGNTAQASTRARQASLLLVIEVSCNITRRTRANRIGWNNAATIDISIASITLANSIDPGRVRFKIAAITEGGGNSKTLTNALHAYDWETWVALTVLAIPDRVRNRSASVDLDQSALWSIIEGSRRADTSDIRLINLIASTLHTHLTVPESISRTDTLRYCGIPHSAISAGLKRHTLISSKVCSRRT